MNTLTDIKILVLSAAFIVPWGGVPAPNDAELKPPQAEVVQYPLLLNADKNPADSTDTKRASAFTIRWMVPVSVTLGGAALIWTLYRVRGR